ncbi:MAG: hypothetical protein ACE14P_01720 [Methanotrichaceae archaeon]
MKKIALGIVLLALCIPVLAADIPNMIGNWTGSFESVGYLKNTNWMYTGNASYWTDNNTIMIQEQNGTRFVGKIIPAENPKQVETVIGVISSDNESLSLVDEDELLWGWMISPTKMDLSFQNVDMDSMAAGSGIFTKQ